MGHRWESFLKIYILGIFGGISSNFSLDRCQKPPNISFDSPGDQGGQGGWKSAMVHNVTLLT